MPLIASDVLMRPRYFLTCGAGEPPPVGVHADLQRRVGQDRRRPIDRVDLGHQRIVDHARDAENLRILLLRRFLRIVPPFRVGLDQAVADGVVLQREQVVQHAQSEPPVLRQSGDFDAGGIDRNHPGFRIDIELAVLPGAIFGAGRRIVAVDLRSVPPMGLGIGIGGRPGVVVGPAGRIGSRAAHRHLAVRPVVAGRDRYVDRIVADRARIAVIEPVVGLELNPGGGQQIEDGRRLEIVFAVALLLPRQQPVAHQPRARVENIAVAGRVDFAQRNVAAEAGARIAEREFGVVERIVRIEAGIAHGRLGQVVVLAVLLAIAQITRVVRYSLA